MAALYLPCVWKVWPSRKRASGGGVDVGVGVGVEVGVKVGVVVGVIVLVAVGVGVIVAVGMENGALASPTLAGAERGESVAGREAVGTGVLDMQPVQAIVSNVTSPRPVNHSRVKNFIVHLSVSSLSGYDYTTVLFPCVIRG